MAWIAEGKGNRDAAKLMGISPRTVEKHLENIFKKLAVENRTAAVIRCFPRPTDEPSSENT